MLENSSFDGSGDDDLRAYGVPERIAVAARVAALSHVLETDKANSCYTYPHDVTPLKNERKYGPALAYRVPKRCYRDNFNQRGLPICTV